ncbi:MAG TPA: helix-hairpin-helix domain-containing protein [Planctomycetaceae bacterium]|nr:helix-hairpin-helix domain-containing protein [Planctomycetaceae bacterium]
MATDLETSTPAARPRSQPRSRSAWWLPPGDDGETVFGLNGRDRWVLTALLVPMAVMIGLQGWRWAETERSAVTVVRAASNPSPAPPADRPPPEVITPTGTTPQQPYVFRVDINTATWIEFAQLDGIGEKLAKRIIADRTENGDFLTVEDLRRVKGIGAKTLEKMRPHLTIKTN